MDWPTILASVTSAFGVTLGAARWLTQRAVDHRLNKDLATFKADLDEGLLAAKAALDADLAQKKAGLDSQVAEAKSILDAALRRDVDEYLGERAAERQYRLDAQKRLYTAIGPLRFQLIIAAAEFANRVANIGMGKQAYTLTISSYFGRSTAFRLLRLFGIAELMERQMAHADFSVDPSTIGLLTFKTVSFRCLSSSSVSLGHPNEDWSNQVEHVFYDALSTIASAMIVGDGPGQRVMRFDEFTAFLSGAKNRKRLHPVPRLLDGLTPKSKPLLWLRFVALAHVSTLFASREGTAIGLTLDPLDTAALLKAANNDFINENVARYLAVFDEFARSVSARTQGASPAG